MQESKDREVILSGPSETGKTIAALWYIHNLAWNNKDCQGVIVRKVLNDCYGSVLQTFEKKILGDVLGSQVTKFGGEKAQWYDYPNGARIWVGGLDHPGKVLSSERDFIYVNQAEQLAIEDWETLTTRATGRAGNVKIAQCIGDCNPGPPQHWIKAREKTGKLKLLETRHEDNPSLFNEDGNVTEQGKVTIVALDGLTGARKLRLRFGQWAQAEGAVYDIWDDSIHLIDRFEIPKDWPRYRVVDFGFTNPFVCQWWAQNPDGDLIRYREIYMTQCTVKVHAQRILELENAVRFKVTRGKQQVEISETALIQVTVCDTDAEDRATLQENGISTIAARKDVRPGIDAVTERLKKTAKGKPRLYLMRGSLVETDPSLANKRKPTCTEEEIPGYVWQVVKDGKPVKEEPLKLDDHGCDGMRYMVMHVDHGLLQAETMPNVFYG